MNPANWSWVNRLQGQNNTPTNTPVNQAEFNSRPENFDNLYISGPGQTTTPAPGGNTLGATSTASTSTYDQNDIDAYNLAISQLQDAQGRLPGQLSAATGNLDSQYNAALQTLLGGKNRAQGEYGTQKLQTGQDFQTGKNSLMDYASNAFRSLQRLLGSRGAGGSSAYNFAAPQAVNSVVGAQKGSLGINYGRNNQSLDTNWGNYLQDYGNQVTGLEGQQAAGQAGLQDKYRTEEASILQQLAELTGQRDATLGGSYTGGATPYVNQANSLLDKVGKYEAPTLNYQTKAYAPPSLDSYTVNPLTTSANGAGAAGDYFSPYLGTLLKDKNKAQFGF